MEFRAKPPRSAVGTLVHGLFSVLARTARRIRRITANHSLHDFTRSFIEPLELRRLLTAWLTGGGTYDPSTNIATITGAATITADPGTTGDTAEPIIEASGSSAVLTINPGDDIFVHLGGLSLSNGATAKVDSVSGGGTEQNHYVVVIGAADATSAPLFSIDTTNGSKLDLADNDLIIHDGASLLPAVQGYLGGDGLKGTGMD